MIVEIWSVGPKNSCSYVILTHHHNDYWWVINGKYRVKPCKETASMYIPSTKETHESHYLGDIDFDEDYNKTIQNYENTKQIVGCNLVAKRKEIK